MILINVLVFVYEVEYTTDFTSPVTETLFLRYGVVPSQIIGALRGTQILGLYTLLTSMFIHAGVFHIFGNMLFLFVFGHNVEERFGHLGYLLFYLIAGVGGAMTQVYLSLLSGPPDISIPSVGASAAISGVLGAYLLFFPRARVVSLVAYFVLPIRAYWFILGWFFLQLLFLELVFSSAGVNSGVAYGAHVGGFVVGLVLGGVARILVGPATEEL
ncbi:MAG TPA: rhomboid family intramembrane serine protease [Nitrososphaerales archaeon]|nr:rhomboid family intramembrane serine protease [Nitrososphaerales archaeon]